MDRAHHARVLFLLWVDARLPSPTANESDASGYQLPGALVHRTATEA